MKFIFSVVKPIFFTKESNFEFLPLLKISNSNVASDFSSLPTFSTNLLMSRVRYLKVSTFPLIVLSTSGNILFNS